jgi:hypothetical protein
VAWPCLLAGHQLILGHSNWRSELSSGHSVERPAFFAAWPIGPGLVAGCFLGFGNEGVTEASGKPCGLLTGLLLMAVLLGSGRDLDATGIVKLGLSFE